MERFRVQIDYTDAEDDVVGSVSGEVISDHLPRIGAAITGLSGLPQEMMYPMGFPLVLQDGSILPLLRRVGSPRVSDVAHSVHAFSDEASGYALTETTVIVRLPDPGLALRQHARDHEPSGWVTYDAVHDNPRDDEGRY